MVSEQADKSKARRRKSLRAVRLLRLLAAPADGRKVRVHVSKAVDESDLGDCTQRKDHYIIRLSRAVYENSPDAVYLILAHEWAHVLAWDDTPDHGNHWGLELARCWRIISGELEGGDVDRFVGQLE